MSNVNLARVDELANAIGDILDIIEGWTRPMTDEQKLAAIYVIATSAWNGGDE